MDSSHLVTAAEDASQSRGVELESGRVRKLIASLQGADQLTPAQVVDIVLDAEITEDDLMPWADFEHPVSDSYGRKLVFDGGHFEIMVMSWLSGDFSAIHDHGSTQWGAVQCFGAGQHYLYGFRDGIVHTAKEDHYSPGSVRAVGNNLIHQMGNGGVEPFLSLHVYGVSSPANSAVTADARIFDLFEGCIQHTDGGVFFCLPDSQINHRVEGVRGDRETVVRHHRHMKNRLERMLEMSSSIDMKTRLEQVSDELEKITAT